MFQALGGFEPDVTLRDMLADDAINMNVLDTQLLEAYEDPTKYPDLVVRVTGFSAYFQK